MLSLSCYKLVCYYFLHLLSTLCTYTCYIFCFSAMLCCSEDEEFLMKTSSRRAGPLLSACGVVSLSATLSFWTCNKFL
jgi:hypothetical protein